MRSVRSVLVWSLVIGLFASLATASYAAGSWQIVQSPSKGQGGLGNNLASVAMLSPTDVWAVGWYPMTGTGYFQTLVENWDGTKWSIVPSPNVTGSTYDVLNGISAVSATDIWAVGYAGFVGRTPERQTLVEHWNGSRWRIVPSPSPGNHSGNDLFGVNAISSSDIWAVGDFFSGLNGQRGGALTIHWNGTRWSVVPNPGTLATLNAVTSLGTSNVWAVGTDALHWDGTKWSHVGVQIPHPSQGISLQSLSATSAGDIWASGFYNYPTPEGTFPVGLIEHSTGSSFTIVPSRVKSSWLYGIKALAPNKVWAVGLSNGPPAIVERWNGTSWSLGASLSPGSWQSFFAVDALASGEAWAVGAFNPGFGSNVTMTAHHAPQ
jgi:hypothetical protein